MKHERVLFVLSLLKVALLLICLGLLISNLTGCATLFPPVSEEEQLRQENHYRHMMDVKAGNPDRFKPGYYKKIDDQAVMFISEDKVLITYKGVLK